MCRQSTTSAGIIHCTQIDIYYNPSSVPQTRHQFLRYAIISRLPRHYKVCILYKSAMAAPSPSEFLTFFRRATMHPALRRGLASRPPRALNSLSSRPFSSSIIRADKDNLSTDSSVKTDLYPDDKHTTDKTDNLDVQSNNSKKGTEYVMLPQATSELCSPYRKCRL